MSELEAEWERLVAEARRRARAAGRGDVAEYLTLRAANDLARSTGVGWLIETFTALAGEANRAGAGLTQARDEAHRFAVGNSTMVGPRLTLRAGVRSLTVEAGWPRAPRDGVVRGGGLASARIGHFGDRAAGEDLLLTYGPGNSLLWVVLDESASRAPFDEARALRHLARLLHEK